MMLGDGNGEFTQAMGLTMDGSKFGLGTTQPALCHGRAERRHQGPVRREAGSSKCSRPRTC